MKRIFSLLAMLCAVISAEANNVQISNVSTSVNGGTTVLNFTVQWDNSWRGGPGNNWDAVWVFVKYKGDLGWYQHLDLTGSDITAPSGLTVTVPTDRKGCFIYRSADGGGNITASNISVGVQQKAGNRDIKVFGLEMVYIPTGSFYLGHAGGNSNNFGEAGTAGTTPFQITSSTPPVIGSSTGNLYDSRVSGTGTFNSSWPTGYNAYYIMKYELSQAGYRDFLNTLPGYLSDVLPERTDLTSSNYATVGTKIFPTGYRNNLYVSSSSNVNHTGTNANGNTTYNEAVDGEWTAANFLFWSDAAAFPDWAALRPMTEFEYEKAVNGPSAADYPQFASGTYININSIFPAGILNPNSASETVTHSSISGDNYINTNEFWGSLPAPQNTGQPLRSGFAADGTSTRGSAGATYYGVMEMSGNLWEPVVTTANVAGRSFNGSLGDGSISALKARANETTWPGTGNNPLVANGGGEVLQLNIAGISKKGGSFAESLYNAVYDVNYDPSVTTGSNPEVYPTNRQDATVNGVLVRGVKSYGCRGVRQQ